MTGILDTIGNSLSNSWSNVVNHPGQTFGRLGAGFAGGLTGTGPLAGGLLGARFNAENQANGTAPDQIRGQQEANSPQATSTAFNDRLAQSLGLGPTDGGAGMTPEQMDQHLLAGYTPTSTNTPAWYDNTTTGAADPLGLVPDYSGSGLAPDHAGGNLAERRDAGNFAYGSGNQLAGGGYSDLMNGASGQMIADMSASTSGDPQQYVVYHSPTSKSSG